MKQVVLNKSYERQVEDFASHDITYSRLFESCVILNTYVQRPLHT